MGIRVPLLRVLRFRGTYLAYGSLSISLAALFLESRGPAQRPFGTLFILLPLLWTPLYVHHSSRILRGKWTLEQWARATVRIFALHAVWFGLVCARPGGFGSLGALWFMAGIVAFSGSITRGQLLMLWLLFSGSFAAGLLWNGADDPVASLVVPVCVGICAAAFLQLSEYQKTLTQKSRELLAAARENTLQMRRDKAKIEEQSRFLEQKNREISDGLDALRATQARLVHQEKLASLGQLTAGIAHEIRNPLNFVMNFADLAIELQRDLRAARSEEERDALQDELAQNLSRVVDYSRRADAIVQNMMKHARTGSAEAQPCDINAVVDDAVQLCLASLRARGVERAVSLHAYLDPSLPRVLAVPQDLSRAVINIVQNALDAMGLGPAAEGGEAPASKRHPILRVQTAREDGRILIRMRDNGVGIPDDLREKIFQPFFTTKPAGQGTGLGLSMSHDIIAAHGGSLSVDSEPDAWTEVRIALPLETHELPRE